jgi:GcrA cell cycle regulator
MEWTDETIARLRELWAEGLSTAEIGRRMAVSKNAVVGKAHRLNLTARPSPIRRDGPALPRTPMPRRVVGPTLPPLTVAPPPMPRPVPLPSQPEVARPAPVRAIPARTLRPQACCWPLGEPGTRSFRFCDAEALPGKPYCAAHAAVAYVRVRDKREDAVA